MKIRSQWLDDFMKWFFNASPMWVDERQGLMDGVDNEPANRRSLDDRRRDPDSRDSARHADRRSNRS